MDIDTPFIEYLIIGSHTALWLLVVAFTMLGVPLTALIHLDASSIILALPFVYLIGMLFESLSHTLLYRFQQGIKKHIFADVPDMSDVRYQDEYIANRSADLFEAYEARVRRVRVVGAAIFNWPLLGIALVWYFNPLLPQLSLFIFGGMAVVLMLISMFAWRDLFRRAYRFRKNACNQLIRDEKMRLETTAGA